MENGLEWNIGISLPIQDSFTHNVSRGCYFWDGGGNWSIIRKPLTFDKQIYSL